MKYDRTIIAYHGCEASVARRILDGEGFEKSRNSYDWIGEGIYFWEYGADRARRWAEEHTTAPAVLGAVIQLGRCFDLMDTKCTSELGTAYELYLKVVRDEGVRLLKNEGETPDKRLRYLDCAVLNWYLSHLEQSGVVHDTVRAAFLEGGPAFRGSKLQKETHVQIAVRSPSCIVGVFRPMMERR
jgi:hypothetical protein